MVQWNTVIHDSQPSSTNKVKTISRRTTSWIPAKLKATGENKESTTIHEGLKMLNRAYFHAWLLSNNARIQPSYYLCPTSYLETGAEKQEQTLSDRHCHVFAPGTSLFHQQATLRGCRWESTFDNFVDQMMKKKINQENHW